jgi:hypothetical protein
MNEQPHDREFEDFLRRRRPLFRGGDDHSLEPPAELDRVVLRQAREAIQEDEPQRLYHAPRWGAPLAIAATLVLGLTFVFKAGMTTTDVRPQVAIEEIAQRTDLPAAVAPAPAAAASSPATAPAETPAVSGAAPTRGAPPTAAAAPPAQAPALVSEEEARRHAPSPPPPLIGSPTSTARDTVADSAAAPAWRQDSRAWLEEIERLRAAGNVAQADAELAEYNRQHRALAVSPDR